ncbi:formylmethanofuran dehydrogenase subunit D [Saccharothrix ecbatanensis]|uniref:Formylmethanofuran dehydrogenase subunit D n=1 Tax=Saccharothrix ecbatanensis TaxID=1105145 RepID=A0A7W9HF39_9PSEU|nr:formylmethanofuran dehydrogenase subunit D [Saccharothrix ecbatanensis]
MRVWTSRSSRAGSVFLPAMVFFNWAMVARRRTSSSGVPAWSRTGA